MSEVVSEAVLPTGEAKGEVGGEPVESKGLLATIGSLSFNLKIILILVGVVIIGLVILRLFGRKRKPVNL